MGIEPLHPHPSTPSTSIHPLHSNPPLHSSTPLHSPPPDSTVPLQPLHPTPQSLYSPSTYPSTYPSTTPPPHLYLPFHM